VSAPAQLPLLYAPIIGLVPYTLDYANRLLVHWEHKLGICERPFRSEAFGLELDGRAIAVAISASAVSSTVAGYARQEVVELARLGRAPEAPWVLRVMLRLWRSVLAPRWECWPVKAAISYHKQAWHSGDIYRFDGWEKIREDCGSSGGGAWTKPRAIGDAALGRKTLWVWRYAA
jgi:hypothetical protein